MYMNLIKSLWAEKFMDFFHVLWFMIVEIVCFVNIHQKFMNISSGIYNNYSIRLEKEIV